MALNITFTQTDTPPPGPGLSTFDIRPANFPVVVEATDVDGTATIELLWRPLSDTTATLTSTSPTTWEITPEPDWLGGSYRIRVSDDSDSVTRTFSVRVGREQADEAQGLQTTLVIPSPMEVADGEATLANSGATEIYRSETNTVIPDSPYSAGSPWGWWRYIRDLIAWVVRPQGLNDVGISEGIPLPNISRGNCVGLPGYDTDVSFPLVGTAMCVTQQFGPSTDPCLRQYGPGVPSSLITFNHVGPCAGWSVQPGGGPPNEVFAALSGVCIMRVVHDSPAETPTAGERIQVDDNSTTGYTVDGGPGGNTIAHVLETIEGTPGAGNVFVIKALIHNDPMIPSGGP